MHRRKMLGAALAGGAALLLMGHSPYRQWYVFRANHLIIVTDVASPNAFPLAEKVAKAIVARLPESKAMAVKARTSTDVVKLLRSHQLQVGLLPAEDAVEAFKGKGRFSDDAQVPLRTLAVFGTYLLVVLDDFPREKAYRITKTLAENPGEFPQRMVPRSEPAIPFHPGALDYGEGRPSPGGR